MTPRRSRVPRPRLVLLLLLAVAAGCSTTGASAPGDGGVSGGDSSGRDSLGRDGSLPVTPGTSFAKTPATWAVPDNAFWSAGFNKAAWDDGVEVWALVDIDGDGRSDLVWTTDPTTQKIWGAGAAPYWKVFRNSGTGFQASASAWPVPDNAFDAQGFNKLAFDDARYVWAVVDIDGDRRPDLVWTTDPNTQKIWGAGAAPHWKVFRNSGKGFEAAAKAWPVPDNAFDARGFNKLAFDDARHVWSSTDMDGDGRPDLVWTTDPTTQEVWGAGAAPHWKVFKNNGKGFASVVAWPVPDNAFHQKGFNKLAFDDARHVWSSTDIDGDGRPDLVWTTDPNTQEVWGVGAAPHWKVFKNNGKGFASVVAWPVPDNAFHQKGFNKLAFDDGQHVWQTGDLDGDGRPDLLWSADPNARKIWGQAAAPHWKIFFNR